MFTLGNHSTLAQFRRQLVITEAEPFNTPIYATAPEYEPVDGAVPDVVYQNQAVETRLVLTLPFKEEKACYGINIQKQLPLVSVEIL